MKNLTFSLWLAPLFALACAGSPPPEAAAPAAPAAPAAAPAAPLDPAAIVAAPDRTEKDKEADARRHPVELLQFLKIQPGSHVADLGAGGGYTTELLVRAVGPEGVVYAQNNKLTLEKYVKGAWPERLQREINHKVVRMDREYEDPFVPEAKDLDLVTLMFSYHDVIAQGGDRAKRNAAVFAALKPGGRFVIVDHAARAGTGTADTRTLHRIDEAVVRREVAQAGFLLDAEGAFLRNPADPRDRSSGDSPVGTDKFVLRFVKP